MKLRTVVAHHRGPAAAAVTALALGIGITALMFAIVDGTVHRGLPVSDPASIVHLERVSPPGARPRPVFLLSEWQALADAPVMEGLAAYRMTQVNVTGDALTPRRWDSAIVTANTFALLGASAARGRVWSAAPDAATRPLLISDDVWREQFAADPAVVGRAIRANGDLATIAGVMPAGFRFPVNHHVWMPADPHTPSMPVQVWGRLASGRSAGEAAAELTTRYQAAARDAGDEGETRVAAAPFTAYLQGPQIVQLLDSMFLAGLAVLAIACANVANLLLARGLARRRDFAIASALGASRWRIMRERLLEGLALAAPGAALGVGLAYLGASLFTAAIAASSPPYWVSVVIDLRVLLFVSAVTIVTAVVAAALPAWRSGSTAVTRALSDESRGTTSGTMRHATAILVGVEIAMAAGVLIAAGLMAKGIVRLEAQELGFPAHAVTVGRVSLPAQGYPDVEDRRVFFSRLYERLRQLPSVSAAALGSSIPFSTAETVQFSLDTAAAEPGRWPPVRRVAVSPGYFDALGVQLVGGRDFESTDSHARAPVAIVNLSFALTHARRQDLIGRGVAMVAATPARGPGEVEQYTIIGVAPDLFVGNPRGELPEAIYVPLLQLNPAPQSISLLARGTAPAASVERDLREAVASIDPDLAVDRAMTLFRFRESATWFYRVFGFLFLAFGVGALLLALVGVYAVMSFAVTRRRREIGTRMALGAGRDDIARMFLAEGSKRLALGLAAGVLLAAWLTPRIALFLFRVSPRDPAVFVGATALVAVVGLAACALPALRAARENPTSCLRDD